MHYPLQVVMGADSKVAARMTERVVSWRLVLEEKPCSQLTILMLHPCVRRVADLKHAVIRGNRLMIYAVW